MSLPIESGKNVDAVERTTITTVRKTRKGFGKHSTREGLVKQDPVILILEK